jgi:hypothetical protein
VSGNLILPIECASTIAQPCAIRSWTVTCQIQKRPTWKQSPTGTVNYLCLGGVPWSSRTKNRIAKTSTKIRISRAIGTVQPCARFDMKCDVNDPLIGGFRDAKLVSSNVRPPEGV